MSDRTLVDVVAEVLDNEWADLRKDSVMEWFVAHPNYLPRQVLAAIKEALAGPDGERHAVELGMIRLRSRFTERRAEFHLPQPSEAESGPFAVPYTEEVEVGRPAEAESGVGT